MSLQIDIKSANNVFVITLAGSFVFNTHRDFRKARKDALESSNISIEIDMDKVEYLDSSALGMLLLLREQANASNRKVALTHCHDLVQDVLNMAHFGRLFTMQ
jgi:anti-anti-sigma factor